MINMIKMIKPNLKRLKIKKLSSRIISAVLVIFIAFLLFPIIEPIPVSAAVRQITLNTVYEDSLTQSSAANQYFFDLAAPASVSIRFEMPYYITYNSWKVSLINSADSANILTKDFGAGSSSATSGTKSESTDRVYLSVGRYYVSVSDYSAYDSRSAVGEPYKISVNINSDSLYDTTGSDEYEREQEPNNQIQNANSLKLNTNIVGNLSGRLDVDYYKITLPAPGALNILFSVASSTDVGNWVVLLYDKNERQIQMSRAGYGGTVNNSIRTNKLDKLRLPAGDYYIKIAPYSDAAWSGADYRIYASYMPETSMRYEKEFNDAPETANKILINAPVDGNLNNIDDYDYFKFTVGEYKDLKIEFSFPDTVAQNSWTIYLFNDRGGIATYSAGQTGRSSTSSTDGGRRTFITDTIQLDAGIYYIAVYAYLTNNTSSTGNTGGTGNDASYSNYSNADYTLLIRSDAAPVPVISDDDNIDYPTEIPPSAYNVNKDLQGYIKNDKDVNVFDFGLNYSGAISVTFQSPSNVAKQSWILNVLDKNNKLLYSGKYGGEALNASGLRIATSNKIRVPAGSYYIQVLPVNAYDYSSGEYKLRVNYTAEAKEALNAMNYSSYYNNNYTDRELYETEYNNTPYTANKLTLKAGIKGNMSDYTDIDYYVFTIDYAGSVKINFTTPKAVRQNTWVVEIFGSDSSLSPLYENTFGAEGRSLGDYSDYIIAESSALRLPKGTYYIRVTAYSNIHFSNDDYELLVDFSQETERSGLYETEFNDTMETANILLLNTDIKGNISSANDLDYFKITVAEAKDIQIKLSIDYTINSPLWAVKVYDSRNNELKSFKIGEGGVLTTGSTLKSFTTEKMFLVPGDYYICVSSYNKKDFSGTEYILRAADEVGKRIDAYVYQADKPSDWALREVELAYGYNLVPESYMRNFTVAIKREEFCALVVKLLVAAEDKPIEEILALNNRQVNPYIFTDTSEASILAANALGIVNGRGNGIFDPNGNITREEAATMLMRLGKLENVYENIPSLAFNDAAKFSSWSADAVTYVSGCIDVRGNRVMNGYTDGGFHPGDSYSREQAFMTIFRLFAIKMGR